MNAGLRRRTYELDYGVNSITKKLKTRKIELELKNRWGH